MTDHHNLLLSEPMRKVARLLIDEPSMENRMIAEKVGLHINTIQPIAKTLKEQVLAPAFRVLDWEGLGLGLRYRVDIQINQRQLLRGGGPDDLSEFLQHCPPKNQLGLSTDIRTQERLALFILHHLPTYVEWKIAEAVALRQETEKEALRHYTERIYIEDIVVLLGGQADLSVAVRAHNSAIIRKFVTHGLRLMAGINNTTTAQEIWSGVEPL